MKNNRLLVLSHLFPGPGHETRGLFVKGQVSALRNTKVNSVVISPMVFGKDNPPRKYLLDKTDVYAPRYLSLGKRFAFLTGFSAYMGAKKLVSNLTKPGLILAHTALPDGGMAQIIAKKLGIPYFVYVHGADVQQKIHYNKWTKQKIRNVLAGAKKVFVNSSKTQRLVAEIGIDSVIIPMGVDRVSTKYTSRGPARTGKREKTKKIRLISVCNLEKEKGIQFAIEALKKIDNQNIEYWIVGSGRYESELKKIARDDLRIKFLGRLSQRNVFAKLSQSDIFVMPSYNEAFGVAYLEAMSFGLPIIGVKGEGVEDIVAKGECGILVEPQDTQSVNAAIEKLIGNLKLRQGMGVVGHKIVIENYLWDRVIKDLIKELDI